MTSMPALSASSRASPPAAAHAEARPFDDERATNARSSARLAPFHIDALMLATTQRASLTGTKVSPRATARRGNASRGRALVVRAQEISVTVDKPLGLTLKERGDGRPGVQIAGCKGNAAKAGLKSGDIVKYHSSFFGDELWPADALAFSRSAISACPNAVDFVVVRDKQSADFDVKRLPKRPAPPKFGRKLTAAQKERASHICVDCGYIYTLPVAFEEQPKSYICPQCNAPKSRFAPYDVETGRAKGGGLSTPLITVASTIAGLAGMAYFLKDVL